MGFWIGCAVWLLLGSSSVACYRSLRTRKKTGTTSLERLKNALLSFALLVTCDVELMKNDLYHDGGDLTYICFTYLQDRDDFATAPFANPAMFAKANEVQRFIARNLSDDGQVIEFFEDFVQRVGADA